MMKTLILTCLTIVLTSSYNAQSIGGNLSSNATVCAGNNAGMLTVSDYTGTIIRWEYSTSGSSLWTPIFFTSSTYNYINLNQTTFFRVIVQFTGYASTSSN